MRKNLLETLTNMIEDESYASQAEDLTQIKMLYSLLKNNEEGYVLSIVDQVIEKYINLSNKFHDTERHGISESTRYTSVDQAMNFVRNKIMLDTPSDVVSTKSTLKNEVEVRFYNYLCRDLSESTSLDNIKTLRRVVSLIRNAFTKAEYTNEIMPLVLGFENKKYDSIEDLIDLDIEKIIEAFSDENTELGRLNKNRKRAFSISLTRFKNFIDDNK